MNKNEIYEYKTELFGVHFKFKTGYIKSLDDLDSQLNKYALDGWQPYRYAALPSPEDVGGQLLVTFRRVRSGKSQSEEKKQ